MARHRLECPLLGDVLLRWQEVHMTNLDRITQQPGMMGGKPCIRGAGRTIEDVLADYPYLEREDILQALRYAAWLAEERQVDIVSA
jgi:uncharacterized protein (DUF433 family)